MYLAPEGDFGMSGKVLEDEPWTGVEVRQAAGVCLFCLVLFGVCGTGFANKECPGTSFDLSLASGETVALVVLSKGVLLGFLFPFFRHPPFIVGLIFLLVFSG